VLRTGNRSVFRSRLVVRVELSGLLARLPLGMCSLAILLWLRAQSSSFVLPGVGVGVYAAALAVASPLQGRLIDRRGRTLVLGISTTTWVVALVGLVLAGHERAPSWLLVLIAGGAGAAMPPFGPAVRALIGELTDDPEMRESAYALDAVLQEVLWITGPLLIGATVGITSPSVAILLTALVGVVGAVWLLAIAPRQPRTRRDDRHRTGAFAEGRLLALVLPVTLVGVGLGATEVGLPALAVHGGNRAAAGLLVALWALGSLLGGVAFAIANTGASMVTRYRALLIALALCQAPLILARSLPAAVALALLAGIAIAPLFTCLYALVGRLAPTGTETEAFAWTSTALIGGAAIGLAAGGALSAQLGIGAPFLLSLAITLAAAASTWILLPLNVERPSARTPPNEPLAHAAASPGA
jgi:MFS family permease